MLFAFLILMLVFLLLSCLCTVFDLLWLLTFACKRLVCTNTLISFNVLKYYFTAELEVFTGAVVLEDFLDKFGFFSGLLLCDCILVFFVVNH